MYSACQNTTEFMDFAICNPNLTDSDETPQLFDEATEKFVII